MRVNETPLYKTCPGVYVDGSYIEAYSKFSGLGYYV